jgi:hypothetical protein
MLIICLGAGLTAYSCPALPQSSADELPAVEIDAGTRAPIRLLRIVHDAADITIDGRIDEPAWFDLPALNNMKVVEPDTLADVAYRTDVRMFYTERGFYISYDMEQPRETIVERYTARDDRDVSRDYVSFSLDTSGTGLYGYWMNLAMGDNQADGTLLPERRYSREWDGAWYGATAITDKGWSAEYFIPWSQMAMPAADDVRRMGIYTLRRVSHLDERWGWPALPDSQPVFMSNLQRLELQDIAPRQQWSVFPFVSSTYDRIDDDVRHKAGVDVFWRPSSNFQLTATVNPDFGSVESDEVVVNLTADETFFPEKRLFFLEGQDIFNTTPRSVSTSGQRFTVVNTRRIGGRARRPELPPGVGVPLRQAVRPTDLLAASKATGQLGAFRYGVLAAFEDESAFNVSDQDIVQEGRDFAALRLLYEDDRGASYRGLGFISTVVAHPESDAVVHAADFHYLSQSGRWNVDGQLLASDRDESGSGYGAYADITYVPRQGLRHTLELTAFDATLDVNDFGFQRRNDVREAWYRMQWVKSGLTRIRNFTISPFLRFEVNGDGYRTNNAVASDLAFTLNNLDTLTLSGAHFPARYDDRNSFGNGTFDVAARTNLSVQYQTNQALTWSFYGKAGYQGEFVGGDTFEAAAGVTWRPGLNVSVDFKTTWFDRGGWLLHQEDRNFTTFDARQWQPQLSVDYFPSAKQHFRLALQWVGVRAEEQEFYTLEENGTALIPGPKPPGPTDDFSLSQLNFQLRYRWQIAPLSDLFIVYTKSDSRRLPFAEFSDLFRESWDEPVGDQLVIKLRYRLGS